MAVLVLIAFIAVPLVEIAVFIEVGGRIGVWNTVLTVILTAVVGTWLLRRQGLRTLQRAQESFSRNVLPVSELFDGLCLLAAGVLLLTPGFVTDAAGLLLFVPPLRRLLRNWIWLTLTRSGHTRVWINGEDVSAREPPDSRRGGGGGTIEGDFRHIAPGKDDKDRDPRR